MFNGKQGDDVLFIGRSRLWLTVKRRRFDLFLLPEVIYDIGRFAGNFEGGLTMLARYTMYRRRPKDAGPLPEGIRQDSRWRTKHVLRPTQEMVESFLANPSEAGWKKFQAAYLDLLNARFAADSEAFENLADLARTNDVYIGCSCPTKTNPDVRHCHTYLALGFMQETFPELEVILPQTDH